MSSNKTQLILYPQNYTGNYSATYTPSSSTSNIIGNPGLTQPLGANHVMDVCSYPYFGPDYLFLINAPILGVWQTYHYEGVLDNTCCHVESPTVIPVISGNRIMCEGNWDNPSTPYFYVDYINSCFGGGLEQGNSGFYQGITGLVVGQAYTVSFDLQKVFTTANCSFCNSAYANITSTSTEWVSACPQRGSYGLATDWWKDILDSNGDLWDWIVPNPNSSTGQAANWDTNSYDNYMKPGTGGLDFITTPKTFKIDFVATRVDMIFGLNMFAPASEYYFGNFDLQATVTIQIPDDDSLIDGQVNIDLYKEEEIPLTLNASDFTNAAENSSSYSKSFQIPSTKRNDTVFNHIFDVTVDSDFNPYKKTKAIVKESSQDVFEGFLKLNKITHKGGHVMYEVNLYSETTNLAGILQSRTVQDIDLAFLNHEYAADNIANSWDGQLMCSNGVPTDILIYPMCDWKGVWNNSLTALEDVFRPWINLKWLFDKILSDAGYHYNSTVLNTPQFTQLFMDFNWGESTTGAAPDTSTYGSVSFNANVGPGYQWFGGGYEDIWMNTGLTSVLMWDQTNNWYGPQLTSGFSLAVTYKIGFTNDDNDDHNLLYRIFHQNGSGNIIQMLDSGTVNIGDYGYHQVSGQFTVIMNPGDKLRFQADRSGSGNTIRTTHSSTFGQFTELEFYGSSTSLTADNLLYSQRGELSQWDIVKGIISRFNLVLISDIENPNKFLIETYDDYYDSPTANTVDWSDKFDRTEVTIEPVDKLSKDIYFHDAVDDDDFLQTQYTFQTKTIFGDASVDNSDMTQLASGQEEVVGDPFSPTICMDPGNGAILPRIFGADEDGSNPKPIANLPRILYSHGKKTLPGNHFSSNPQNNSSSFSNEDQYILLSQWFYDPTQTVQNPLQFEQNWGMQPVIWNSFTPTYNIYNTYWQKYIDTLYDKTTRIVKGKIFLTGNDINNFRFNDKILIKNRAYRVNKIDFRPGNISKIELILLPA